MKLVVGLGNPGPRYAASRHNVGFMVLDELLQRWSLTPVARFDGAFARGRLRGEDTLFLKPMTYMNNSGVPVELCSSFYDVDPEHTVVVHDELDVGFGEIRVKRRGGHAGHNGLRSLFEHVGPGSFARVRVGIGRPEHGDITSYVLGGFDEDQAAGLPEVITRAADATETVVIEGVEAAMNQFNRRTRAPSAESVPVEEEEERP